MEIKIIDTLEELGKIEQQLFALIRKYIDSGNNVVDNLFSVSQVIYNIVASIMGGYGGVEIVIIAGDVRAYNPLSISNGVCYMNQLYSDGIANKGATEAFISIAEQWARARGCKKIGLFEQGEGRQEFLKKFGFYTEYTIMNKTIEGGV